MKLAKVSSKRNVLKEPGFFSIIDEKRLLMVV